MLGLLSAPRVVTPTYDGIPAGIIVALGDSLCAGQGSAPNHYGLSASDKAHSWAEIVAASMGRTLKVVHSWTTYIATEGYSPSLAWCLPVCADQIEDDIGLVIIQWAEHFWDETLGLTTTEEIATTYGLLRAWALGRGAKILTMSRYSPTAPSPASDAYVQALCPGDIYCYVSDIGVMPGSYSPGGDGWHPVDLGHERIAARALERLRDGA